MKKHTAEMQDNAGSFFSKKSHSSFKRKAVVIAMSSLIAFGGKAYAAPATWADVCGQTVSVSTMVRDDHTTTGCRITVEGGATLTIRDSKLTVVSSSLIIEGNDNAHLVINGLELGGTGKFDVDFEDGNVQIKDSEINANGASGINTTTGNIHVMSSVLDIGSSTSSVALEIKSDGGNILVKDSDFSLSGGEYDPPNFDVEGGGTVNFQNNSVEIMEASTCFTSTDVCTSGRLRITSYGELIIKDNVGGDGGGNNSKPINHVDVESEFGNILLVNNNIAVDPSSTGTSTNLEISATNGTLVAKGNDFSPVDTGDSNDLDIAANRCNDNGAGFALNRPDICGFNNP